MVLWHLTWKIYVSRKNDQIARYLQKLQNCHACQNFLFYSRCVRKHVFLFLKIRQKPTSPAMRNNEFNSRGLKSFFFSYQSFSICIGWVPPCLKLTNYGLIKWGTLTTWKPRFPMFLCLRYLLALIWDFILHFAVDMTYFCKQWHVPNLLHDILDWIKHGIP